MTTDKSKRKLVAVVHADVKGYSRMMGEDAGAPFELWRRTARR